MHENNEFVSVPENFPISVRLPEGAMTDSIESDQSSRPGDLVNQASPARDWADYFAKQAVVNMPVPLNEILEITTVRSYATPSTSDRPIVWRTRDAWYGLDALEKTDAARLLGETSIECRVHFMENCTEEDLAFAKAAVRMKPEGGPASHAEIVAANASVAGIYTLNRATMFTNQHGGLRIPGQHNSEAEDNLVNALSKGLGKDRKTILRYLNHSAYLENGILGTLADARVVKSFFEGIHKAKNAIVTKLTGRGMEPSQIAAQVSEAVRAIFDDYQAKNKLDQEIVKSVVARFTEGGAGADQQGPEPLATATVDNNEPDESALEHRDDAPLEQKKDEVTGRLSGFASLATAVNDDAGLKSLAREILTYGFALCCEMLPQELEAILEELRAAHVG